MTEEMVARRRTKVEMDETICGDGLRKWMRMEFRLLGRMKYAPCLSLFFSNILWEG